MNNTSSAHTSGLLKTTLLSISFIISSTILGTYLFKSCQSQRNVTVRRLAERDGMANLGIWPICFRLAEDGLIILQKN